jgi:hypothetical protein
MSISIMHYEKVETPLGDVHLVYESAAQRDLAMDKLRRLLRGEPDIGSVVVDQDGSSFVVEGLEVLEDGRSVKWLHLVGRGRVAPNGFRIDLGLGNKNPVVRGSIDP